MTSRLYPDRPYLAASVAVIREGRVLLAARARPPLARLFSLPGGVVEPGETLAEAALRELEEETGIRAEILGFLAPVEIIARDEAERVRSHFVVCAHAARWLSGEGQASDEVLEVRWLSEAELESLPMTPGLVPILRAALAWPGQIRPGSPLNPDLRVNLFVNGRWR